MKKIITATICFFIVSMIIFVPQKNASTVHVLINEERQVYDQSPIIEKGRTLVPLRGIFETLGATVEWNQKEQKVTAKREGKTVELIIGEKVAKVGNANITLDVPAKVMNGRTLVPLRFVSEALGSTVQWMKKTHTVVITDDILQKYDQQLLSYFPQEGKFYYYKGDGNEYAPYSEEIFAKQGNFLITFVANGGTRLQKVYYVKNGEMRVVYSEGEVYDYPNIPLNKLDTTDRRNIVLSAPFEKGKTMKNGLNIVDTNTTVEVPYGKFKNVLVLSNISPDGYVTTEYWVQGIGQIKSVTDYGDFVIQTELQYIEDEKIDFTYHP